MVNKMNIQEALSILGIISNATQSEIKTAYRVSCKKYHPDLNPAGLEMMKSVNVAWNLLKGLDSVEVESYEASDYGSKLNDAINAIINLDGVIVEVCGTWVWVSGDTRPHKDAIKNAGFKWASKKKQWYFKPDGYKKRSKGEYSMDEIRSAYGSEPVNNKGFKGIK